MCVKLCQHHRGGRHPIHQGNASARAHASSGPATRSAAVLRPVRRADPDARIRQRHARSSSAVPSLFRPHQGSWNARAPRRIYTAHQAAVSLPWGYASGIAVTDAEQHKALERWQLDQNAVRATAFFSSPAQILQLRMTAAATLTVSQLGTSLGPRMVRARGDQDAVTVKVTMKQPRLRPALATSSHVPGTGMGIPDG